MKSLFYLLYSGNCSFCSLYCSSNSVLRYTMAKSLVLITGASRGIGRAIALSIVDACQKEPNIALSLPVHIVLIARSTEKLQETARLVLEKCHNDETKIITTSCHELDLSNLDSLPNKMEQIFHLLNQSTHDQCWLFNNAGSVEPLGAISSLATSENPSTQMSELRNSIDLNITSSIWLSAMFTRAFSTPDTSVRIVNISSLCAIKPFPTMAVYCAGKAARDMFHMVLSKEISGRSEGSNRKTTADSNRVTAKFKTLNYAPGACDTAMTDVLADCPSLDSELHDYFESSKKERNLIDPVDSARKLIGILVKDDFICGSHVDYWDD